MPHLPKTNIPTLLVEQTIEYLVYKHVVENQAPFFLRPFLAIDVAKLKFWEAKYWRKADKVVAVSKADKEQMLELTSDLDVGIVPNGVSLDFFKVKAKWEEQNPKILFVANFKWMQNVEAAEVLINEVFPRIKKGFLSAKLWIVGQHIPEEIKNKKSKEIIIDDLAESDEKSVKDAYWQASVFVSPLRGPGGTRLKHFAAMAAKLPLVTTAVGAEGLSAKNQEHILIRNKPEDIAKATIALLKSPKEAQRIADNARALVEEKFSWDKIGEYLEKIYEETAQIKKA
jgi:glycosyltransferase involved in cell wall biosynthesis